MARSRSNPAARSQVTFRSFSDRIKPPWQEKRNMISNKGSGKLTRCWLFGEKRRRSGQDYTARADGIGTSSGGTASEGCVRSAAHAAEGTRLRRLQPLASPSAV